MACFAFSRFLKKKILQIRFPKKQKPSLFFKGCSHFFRAIIKGMHFNKNLDFKAFDLTPISLNGCRLKKQRRT